MEKLTSPELRLKPGTADSLCSALPAQAPLLHHCGRGQEGSAGRRSARSPPTPSLLCLGSTLSRSVPESLQGCICHRSLAAWLEAPGEGAQSEVLRPAGRGLPCPSCGLRLPLQGWGKAWSSAPSHLPGPAPRSLQPGSEDALAALPQRSLQPVLNLNDSCPQPSQLPLISEGFQGLGWASHRLSRPGGRHAAPSSP